ncbi:MAG TPA: methionine--tRNA ligase [Acidimicrobiia bacterium]|nr:methionine--tRNA ligase [Acidimicrobiia bacterium]
MIYLSTPIYYPNDRPHIGTAYTTLVADAVARYWRLVGEEVYAVTGVDEYGLKIARAAEGHGMSPQQWVDHIVGRFHETWTMLDMSFDDFIRTTEERHRNTVQTLLQRMYDAGDVYLSHYEGPYCVGCEAYYTADQLVDGKCPVHGRPVEVHSEDNWFFRWSRYGDRLLEHIAAHPEFVTPGSRRNEVVGFIEQGLEDISMSRSSLTWGIPLPWDESQVAYVWFDALINYVSAAGFSDDPDRFANQWPAWAHLVGKDILRFHAVLWPAMLMSAGLALPRQIAVHGWLLVGGEKMSKSNASQILPSDLVPTFGSDGYRYHFLRDVSFGPDGNFSWEGMVERYNADLANDLGNLANRVLNLAVIYRSGRVPAVSNHTAPEESVLVAAAAEARDALSGFGEFRTKQALDGVWRLFAAANAFVEATAPWHLAKNPETAGRLDQVLNAALEALRVGAVLVSPVMPSAASRLWAMLGLPGGPGDGPLASTGVFGTFPAVTVTKGDPLFPRIEVP